MQGDVADGVGVALLFDAATTAFGPVTGLVNNAAVNELRLIEQTDAALFDRLFRTRPSLRRDGRPHRERLVGRGTPRAPGRLGQPDDIASVIAFLMSGEGGWMTGQVIDANGGRGI